MLGCSLALAVTLAAPAAAPPVAPGAAFPFPIHRRALDNGLQVVFVRHPTPGLVAYLSVFRVGSRNEVEPGRSGFAHFFEHLSFRGSRNIPGDEWERITKSIGADDNAFTDDDLTAYWLVGPSDALPRIVEIEADRFQHLDFAEDDFRIESRAVLGELLKSMVSPDFAVEEAGRDLAFSRHTYKHTTIGFEKDVRDMPSGYRYARELYRRFYTPDNATILVVGDFDEERAFAEIQARYGGWRGVGERPAVPVEPPQREAREKRIPWASPVLPRLWSAWHTPAGSDVDATAIQLVLWPYLFDRASPLYRELVLERHLAEAIGGEFQPHRDPYLFGYELVLRSSDAEAPARAAIDAALSALAEGRVDEPLLAGVRSHLLASLAMDSDTPHNAAVWLAYYVGLTGDPGYLDTIMGRVARVTSADLAAFARQWLVPTNRTTVVVANVPVAPSASTGAGSSKPGGAR